MRDFLFRGVRERVFICKFEGPELLLFLCFFYVLGIWPRYVSKLDEGCDNRGDFKTGVNARSTNKKYTIERFCGHRILQTCI